MKRIDPAIIMNPNLVTFIQFLAYLGLAIGIIGTVMPIIPGPLIVWLSALLWAWADGFELVGWPTLIVMGIIAIVAEIGDLAFAALGARQGGASTKSLIIGAAGAVIGLIVFNLPGALIGAVLGILGWEAYQRGGEWREAWRASRGIIIGYVISIIVKFFFVAIMLAIFAWQAFFAN